jgi:hypothetical protein
MLKTSELTGAALDWAVAKCEPDDTLAIYFDEVTGEPLYHDDWQDNQMYKPSTDWAQAGPIIEREGIVFQGVSEAEYMAYFKSRGTAGVSAKGPTHLVAAMRCYVASKLGDTVDAPAELTT